MSNLYNSRSTTPDNEQKKFQPDSVGNVAVNVIGEQLTDIVDAITSSTVVTKQNPTIHNVTLTLANTEYSQALATNVKSFIIRSRNRADVKLSYVLNQSATNYVTVLKNAVYEETGLDASGVVLYFQSALAGTTVEIVEWV